MKLTWSAIVPLLLCLSLADAGQVKRVIPIYRASSEPKLTGTLTNPVWRDATVFTSFSTSDPESGKHPSQRTSAYIMYNAENIFVGVRMFDKELNAASSPSKSGADIDSTSICFDMTKDGSEALYFQSTASGEMSNGTTNITGKSVQTNLKDWRCVTKVMHGEWIAEFQIPFKAIGISKLETTTVGFKVIRRIKRTGEVIQGPTVLSNSPGDLAKFQAIRFTAIK